jgi:hypothetical protein
MNTYKDEFTKIKDEIELSCFFGKNTKVSNFAFKIFYEFIIHANNAELTDKEIIGSMLELTHSEDPNLIDKPGFDMDMAKFIYNIIIIRALDENDARKLLFGDNIQDNIHQMMGTIYTISKHKKCLYYAIKKNPTLKNNFMRKFRKLFLLPDTFNDKDFKFFTDIIDKEKGARNRNILLDLIGHQNCPVSLYRRQLSYHEYVRSKRLQIESKPVSSYTNCHKNYAYKNVRDDKKIILANSYYDIDNTIFLELFRKYKRKSVAGPSGSATAMYVGIFNSLDIKTTLENKILLLCCLVADFVPAFHSLPEILVTYMYEVPELSFKYDLSMDPVEYTKQITKKYLNLSITKKSPTPSRKTSRKTARKTVIRPPKLESHSESSHPMVTRSRSKK